ncbi:MAG: cation transporter [Burkholderiales bacterium]|nr:cation transporter [Burkholderiales bacterium]
MSAHCHDHGCSAPPPADGRYRNVLWVALIVNAAMFLVEIIGGIGAQSTSLLADAIDFFGDAVNYGVSLFVLSQAMVWRSRTALAKGITMGLYGIVVLAATIYNISQGVKPEAVTMGAIGLLALAANLSVAVLLYRFRQGDANMRSVWLCTRNDAIGNVAIVIAALGVFGTGTGWPDFIVAAIMGTLGITAAISVIRQSRAELVAAP